MAIADAVPPRGAALQRSDSVSSFVRHFASDPNSVLERQLCMASTYLLSQFLFLIPGVSAVYLKPVLAGGGLMVAATVGAYFLRAPAVPHKVAMVIPLVDILAVGLLRAGTGGVGSIFTFMLVLPVISLGVEPGRLPMVIGGPVTIIALLLPVIYDPTQLGDGQWSRIIFGPLILGLTCLSVNEMARRLRSRVRAVQRLRREQDRLLEQARDNADASAATSALLRESTNELVSVIDAVTEQAIVGTDRTGRVDVFNTGAQKMLGVAAHDAIGRSIARFDGFDELTGALEQFLTEVRSGTPQVRDWTYTQRDGTQLSIKVAVTARRDAAGEVDGFLFVGTDVTADREQARMKDQFVNLISHELRTPLSSILGYLELLEDDDEAPLTVEQAQYVVTIERNANRLLRLVSDLLFTAQVESGRFQVQEQSVELHSVVTASIDSAGPVAAARGVTLQMAACQDPVFVSGDPLRLAQAIDNLVSNAVKFTPSGGRVAVTLGADSADSADSADGARALISVSDTGVGIPAEEVDRLFSRFFRASTASANAIPGVGLGLSITRAIAVAHRGEVRVASTVGAGTTFTLDLPQVKAPGSPDTAVPAALSYEASVQR